MINNPIHLHSRLYRPKCLPTPNHRPYPTFEMASPATNRTGTVPSVAVVGAGVSGLAAAYKLKSNGLKVTVLESEERASGKIRSCSRDGFIWDEGANAMTESEMDVGLLIDNLGLREMQQFLEGKFLWNSKELGCNHCIVVISYLASRPVIFIPVPYGE